MQQTINTPLFCLTSDIDWASEYAIRDFLSILGQYGVKPTVFATHSSPVLAEFEAAGAIEIGVHPNFLPGSSHGSDVDEVVEHMLGLFPQAQSFRSHHFFETSLVSQRMFNKGIRYDSNLCLYLQPNLTPLRTASGPTRFPVFWEDDVHYAQADMVWDADRYLAHFLTPGLKILNFHPFFVAANIPDDNYYRQVKDNIATLDADNVDSIRYTGKGARTFLIDLLEKLTTRGERFYRLSDLYTMLPVEKFLLPENESEGRHNILTDEDYQRYWNSTDAERQESIRQNYEKRNPTDYYATSRDYHLRELEIDSMRQVLTAHQPGRMLDLGCGNGYTLLSLSKLLDGWDMLGVDFSQNMINGANQLREQFSPDLKSQVAFVCADAIQYIRQIESESFNYIITERFLQNMPNTAVQHDLIREAYRVLTPGGKLLMCEGSIDGFEQLNDLRESVGLYRIPATSADNASAIRFEDAAVKAFAEQEVGFRLVDKRGYSSFFVIARVVHPALVQPQSPRFDAPINEVAMNVQKHMPYEAGYGGNQLWVFEK